MQGNCVLFFRVAMKRSHANDKENEDKRVNKVAKVGQRTKQVGRSSSSVEENTSEPDSESTSTKEIIEVESSTDEEQKPASQQSGDIIQIESSSDQGSSPHEGTETGSLDTCPDCGGALPNDGTACACGHTALV